MVRSITERQKSLFEMINDNKSDLPQLNDSGQQLEKLKISCLACSCCDLRNGCEQVVFGDGNPHARLMLIGEGPGADEDRLGIPFVGRAGQLLDRILNAAQIKRDQIYITNVVKCRPPANRLPVQNEVDTCLSYLKKQIELIDPKLILCLGALAARTLVDKSLTITRIRGQWYEIGGRRWMATFHPAALLRDPGKKKAVWEDFKQIMKYYHNTDSGSCSR